MTTAMIAVVAAAAPAQRQFDELRKRGLPPDRDRTTAVALSDVDGDGNLDMIVGNHLEQNRLYLNDGTALGTFTDATARCLPANSDGTRAVALGDVDSDGDLDIVFANGGYTGGHQNRLLLNDGTGTFVDITAARMPTDDDDSTAVALGDVDGDGDLDMVFGTIQHFPHGRTQNRLFVNDGTGTFTDATAARMPVDHDTTWSVALADVDGDGDLDMICGNEEQNRLYLNDGAGTFRDATASHMPDDNHEGTAAIAHGDVDGDGDVDLFLGNAPVFWSGTFGINRLYLNDGTGVYSDVTAARLLGGNYGENTTAVALADVDGDMDLDIVLAHHNEQNLLYLNDGTGTFTNATVSRMPVDQNPTAAVAVGDVDADGDVDIVFGTSGFSGGIGPNPGEPNRLYLNEGAGTYIDATKARVPDGVATSVALGDVDNDGDLDVVYGKSYGDLLYLNDGSGRYSDATSAHMPSSLGQTFAVALGDVDGDADLDLVLGRSSSYSNDLYFNDGTGTYTEVTAARLPPKNGDSRAVALGDVDRDGDLDIVFGNWGPNWLYLNDGTGTFIDATATHLPTDSDETNAVTLGDVDGDGDLDLVCGNGDGSGYLGIPTRNRLYLNDGGGIFTDVTAARMPVDIDATSGVALGDLDGDGDLDLVCANGDLSSPAQNRVYFNDGTGTFTDATMTRMPVIVDWSWAAALGDVDGDGDLDLALGSGLLINLEHQLEAPFLLRSGHPYTLEVYARYGPPSLADIALPFVSAGTARIPAPPFGTLGLDPTQTVALPPFLIPQPAGVGSISLTVPHAPALAGASLHAQVLLVPYPFQAVLTNITSDTLVR